MIAKVVQGYSCQGFLTNVGKWKKGVQSLLCSLLMIAGNVTAEGQLRPVGVSGKDTGIQTTLLLNEFADAGSPFLCVATGTAATQKNKHTLRSIFLSTFFTEMETTVYLILACVFLIYICLNVYHTFYKFLY